MAIHISQASRARRGFGAVAVICTLTQLGRSEMLTGGFDDAPPSMNVSHESCWLANAICRIKIKSDSGGNNRALTCEVVEFINGIDPKLNRELKLSDFQWQGLKEAPSDLVGKEILVLAPLAPAAQGNLTVLMPGDNTDSDLIKSCRQIAEIRRSGNQVITLLTGAKSKDATVSEYCLREVARSSRDLPEPFRTVFKPIREDSTRPIINRTIANDILFDPRSSEAQPQNYAWLTAILRDPSVVTTSGDFSTLALRMLRFSERRDQSVELISEIARNAKFSAAVHSQILRVLTEESAFNYEDINSKSSQTILSVCLETLKSAEPDSRQSAIDELNRLCMGTQKVAQKSAITARSIQAIQDSIGLEKDEATKDYAKYVLKNLKATQTPPSTSPPP